MSNQRTILADQFTRADEPIRLVSRLHGPRPYRVGELFLPEQTRFEPDAIYGLDRNGHTLTIFAANPSPQLISAAKREPVELALVVQSPLIIILYRLEGEQNWSSIPYSWPLRNLRQTVQIVPPARLPEHSGALLWLTLVDADNGLIVSQRGVPMNRRFAQMLHKSIRDQVRDPFVPDQYVGAIRSIYEKPVDPEMLALQAVARMRFDGSCMM